MADQSRAEFGCGGARDWEICTSIPDFSPGRPHQAAAANRQVQNQHTALHDGGLAHVVVSASTARAVP
jgi:hypothetical protein